MSGDGSVQSASGVTGADGTADANDVIAATESDGASEPLLRVENLTKHFPHDESWFVTMNPWREKRFVQAVDDVSFDLERGVTMGLVGESGCGKSTLARTIVRLIEPTSGSIRFKGEDVVGRTGAELKAFRKDVQMIFQDPFASLNPRYSVRKTLTEPMEIHGIGSSDRDRAQRAADLLEDVGVNVDHIDRYPHEFSGGQRQRIAIARALAVEPDLLVADEPTSALDVSVQASILELLNDLKEERQLSMLFISHDLSVVRYLSDELAVMYLGNLVETGETNEVFEDPKHPYTKSLLQSIPSPDPTNRSDFVTLRGDVPTPIDPPTGCRFHTRCPEIIPPEDWNDSQQDWYEVFHFVQDVDEGIVEPEEVARYRDGAGLDAFVDERVAPSLSREAVDVLTTALDHVAEEETDEAIALLDESFRSPCRTRVPADHTKNERGDFVKCHLYE